MVNVPLLKMAPPSPAAPPPPPPNSLPLPPLPPWASPPLIVRFCSVRLPELITSKRRIVVPAADRVMPLLPVGPVMVTSPKIARAVGPNEKVSTELRLHMAGPLEVRLGENVTTPPPTPLLAR